MNKIKRNITVLAIDDKTDFDAYKKFNNEKESFISYGFDYFSTNYRRLLQGKVPRIKTEKIIIFLFFPFDYWNRYIEHKNYKGIYGNHIFHRKFVRFWNMVEEKIKKNFREKELLYVNSPQLCGIYRDKLTVIKKLTRANIPQPKLYKRFGIEEIQKKLACGHKFFLKPRYGSMGKGITFLKQSSWQTNFIFKNNRIISRRSDYGWRFMDITGNFRFLRQLLGKDILVQEAIEPPILKNNKLDLRIYNFFNKVIYVYPRKNTPDKVITNISQGGRGDPKLLKMLPEELLLKAKGIATRVSEVLNLGFAGIDIIPDRNFKNVYVIDVNVFSGFPKRRTFNLARSLAKQLCQLNDEERLHFKRMS